MSLPWKKPSNMFPNANPMHPNRTQSTIPFPLPPHHTLLPRHTLPPPLHLVDLPLNGPLFRHQRRPDLFQLRDLLFGGRFADFLHHLGVGASTIRVALHGKTIDTGWRVEGEGFILFQYPAGSSSLRRTRLLLLSRLRWRLSRLCGGFFAVTWSLSLRCTCYNAAVVRDSAL